ncbi:hypothetical protein F5148DRAFT_440867 [Russula earlei]|uniref:Uncharacterized protein n=1 Tax=Russula earlei TaxID=71964 RepID=A0ACC0UHP5_9AGAM|nr:hypothetical protein F5148DRAFT_440867 [Russula earlei]
MDLRYASCLLFAYPPWALWLVHLGPYASIQLYGRRRAPTCIPGHRHRQLNQHPPQLFTTRYPNQSPSLLLDRIVSFSRNPRRMYINISMSLVSSMLPSGLYVPAVSSLSFTTRGMRFSFSFSRFLFFSSPVAATPSTLPFCPSPRSLSVPAGTASTRTRTPTRSALATLPTSFAIQFSSTATQSALERALAFLTAAGGLHRYPLTSSLRRPSSPLPPSP